MRRTLMLGMVGLTMLAMASNVQARGNGSPRGGSSGGSPKVGGGGSPKIGGGGSPKVGGGGSPKIGGGQGQIKVGNGQTKIGNGQTKIGNGQQNKIGNGQQNKVGNGQQNKIGNGHHNKIGQGNHKQGNHKQGNHKNFNKNYHTQHGKKFSHGYCYSGRSHCHWQQQCWWPKYNCHCYYCPSACNWYYWCAPQACYYPVSYCQVAAPTVCEAPVANGVGVVENGVGFSNGSGQGALPPGAGPAQPFTMNPGN